MLYNYEVLFENEKFNLAKNIDEANKIIDDMYNYMKNDNNLKEVNFNVTRDMFSTRKIKDGTKYVIIKKVAEEIKIGDALKVWFDDTPHIITRISKYDSVLDYLSVVETQDGLTWPLEKKHAYKVFIKNEN